MLPADQRLCAYQLAGAHVHLGLVIQHELVLAQRPPQLFEMFVMLTHAAVLRRVKDVIPVLTALLGQVHGLVGLTDQLFGIHVFVLRVKSDA